MHTRNRLRTVVAIAVALLMIMSGTALAAVSWIAPAVSTNGTTASSLTLNAPALNAGDVLLAQVTASKDFSTTDVICPASSGWTSIAKVDYDNKVIHEIFSYSASSAVDAASHVWTVRANSCGGSQVSGKGMTGGLLRYSGVATVAPVASRKATGSQMSATAPGVATTQDGAMIVRFFSAFKSLTFLGSPLYTVGSTNLSAERTAAAYQVTQTTSGPTGEFTANMSTSAEWVSTTVALQGVDQPPPPVNAAPKVATAAPDSNGNEGDLLSTSGAFSDPDGDSLTITKQSGGGTVTPGANGAWSWSMPTTDNGGGTVVVRATDPGGLYVEDTFDWSAANVAPSATFNHPASVNEGADFTLSLSNPADPSSADTAAGFQYRFDCGTGYGAWGNSSAVLCPSGSSGTRNVKGEIRDKDEGAREYTGSVSVTPSTPPPPDPVWTATGFYQPVGVTNSVFVNGPAPAPSGDTVWNTAKGGATIPLKFNVFVDGTEKTTTTGIVFTTKGLTCPGAGAESDEIDFVTTGSTSLRYDTSGQQFIQNWASPKVTRDSCYRATAEFSDGSTLSAFFRLRK